MVDLDGVVWIGRNVLWDNVQYLKSVKGANIVFITNNSTLSRRDYAQRLSSLGLWVTENDVVTSGWAAALWLTERLKSAKVYVVGEKGLIEELSLAGLQVTDDPEEAEAVVVGLDREFTYEKLSKALKAIMKGVLFVATSRDPRLPTEEGEKLGAGAIVAALEYAAGRKSDFVAGKPNPWIAEVALRNNKVRFEDIIVIGDRIESDVELALRIGAKAILVSRSEETSLKELKEKGVIVVKSLKELPHIIEVL
ncbi:MAG: HAD-IIA family hydrolase [Acidilobaceae archaeon]